MTYEQTKLLEMIESLNSNSTEIGAGFMAQLKDLASKVKLEQKIKDKLEVELYRTKKIVVTEIDKIKDLANNQYAVEYNSYDGKDFNRGFKIIILD